MSRIYFLSIIFLLTACKQKNIEEKITSNIKNICNKDSCLTSLSNIIDYKCDTLYVFDYYDESILHKIIKTPLPYWDAMTIRYVFLSKGQVMHYEDVAINTIYSDIDPIRNKVSFVNNNDSLQYFVCDVNKDLCLITKVKDKHGKYYVIRCIE